MAKRVEYKAFVKHGYSKYEKGKWHGVAIGWDTDLGRVKKGLEEYLNDWNGKPMKTAREVRSAQFAKEMMVTDWKIQCREVTPMADVLTGHRDAPIINEADDPKEDYFLI